MIGLFNTVKSVIFRALWHWRHKIVKLEHVRASCRINKQVGICTNEHDQMPKTLDRRSVILFY